MDLSTDQKGMGLQSRYATEYGNHTYKLKETFEETDIKGNNNLFNSLKTETNGNHSHDTSSLLQVKYRNEKNLQVSNSLFSYSSFKKAMDLRTHNRTLDGRKRTIFDDAEYFAKNYRYKLLPITFEQVDETIIHSEHNYSLFSLNSESESEDNFSRTMDYSQVKEKNYKRRRTKFRERSDKEDLVECEDFDGDGVSEFQPCPIFCHQNESYATEPVSLSFESDNSNTAQPLDLSNAPFVQEEKTDPCLRERPNSITEKNACDNDEVAQLDSDKENLNSELNGIRVTITRPDEKENYQPCDLFLNDIARLVPWLIDKDCFEVDILDRTCDHQDEFRKHRLYYVISESTWRLFQRTNERIILTNDSSLGQPLRKAEKDERPSYLVFDQFSLAKCLAEHCQEIGGCFEYTCVEELKDEEHLREVETKEIKKIQQGLEEMENLSEIMEEAQKIDKESGKNSEEVKAVENLEKTLEDTEKEAEEESMHEIKSKILQEEEIKHSEEKTSAAENVKILFSEPKKKAPNTKNEKKPEATDHEVDKEQREKQFTTEVTAVKENVKYKATKKPSKAIKRKQKSVTQPRSKTVRSKSTSESETSQMSDKPVSRKEIKKRKNIILSKEEPPSKCSRSIDLKDSIRRTRSGKILEKDTTSEPTAKKKESAELKGRRKKEKEMERAETKVKEVGRSLRSQTERKGKGKEEKRRKRG